MASGPDSSDYPDWLTGLVAGELAGSELRAETAARFASPEAAEQAAREVEIARRVSALMKGLRAADIEVPAGFEARLLARVRQDETLLAMLELYLTGFGRVLVELINLLFGLMPAETQPQPAAAL